LIASNESDLSFLRDNSYVTIKGQDYFYKIVGKEKSLYIKDVEVKSDDSLSMSGQDRFNFCVNDSVTFTHKQHTIIDAKLKDGGKNFKVDDVLSIDSGVCSINSYDGTEALPVIRVKKVNESGKILKLDVLKNSGGVFNVAPDLVSEVSSVSGSEAKLSLTTEKLEKRVMEDRLIKEVDHEMNSSTLTLNHPLPKRFKFGKVSVNKWELILNIPYNGGTESNCVYTISSDFTPHLSMPLMHAISDLNPSAYNESISILDMKIKELENKIENLS
jgi:hypothetical protein